MSWLLCYIFYTAAVFITLLFWTMLYEASEGPPTYFNLYVHGLQARFKITCTCKYFNINIITYHHYSGPVCCHWSVCLKQTVALWKDMDMSPFWCYLCYIQCDLLGCWWTGSLGLVNIVWRRLFSVIFSNFRKSLCVPCDWLGKWPWQCYGHSGNRSGSLSTDSHIFLGSEPV